MLAVRYISNVSGAAPRFANVTFDLQQSDLYGGKGQCSERARREGLGTRGYSDPRFVIIVARGWILKAHFFNHSNDYIIVKVTDSKYTVRLSPSTSKDCVQ